VGKPGRRNTVFGVTCLDDTLALKLAPYPLAADRPPSANLVRSAASQAAAFGPLLLRSREGVTHHGGCEDSHGDEDDIHCYRHKTLPTPDLIR
jgi:hypothetical protein